MPDTELAPEWQQARIDVLEAQNGRLTQRVEALESALLSLRRVLDDKTDKEWLDAVTRLFA